MIESLIKWIIYFQISVIAEELGLANQGVIFFSIDLIVSIVLFVFYVYSFYNVQITFDLDFSVLDAMSMYSFILENVVFSFIVAFITMRIFDIDFFVIYQIATLRIAFIPTE